MSALCTLSRTWPFLTVSPRRASISTTRPVASEITGTVLEMSGVTVPVTLSSGAAMCSTAAIIRTSRDAQLETHCDLLPLNFERRRSFGIRIAFAATTSRSTHQQRRGDY